MRSARWRKLLGDARAERGRLALMGAAIALSLVAVGAVLGAWAVLRREIRVNYLGTQPAHATLELPGGVDDQVLATARASGLVAAADAREVVLGRVQVGDARRPLLLFVARDFADLQVNRFAREHGAWPPPTGTVLLERSAIAMAGVGQGGELRIKTPRGAPRTVRVTGIVHDPGLAPAWQEREVYAYTTPETLAELDGDGALHELRVTLAPAPRTASDAEAGAEALATWLGERGIAVHQLRVPPPEHHPHQTQMTTVLLMMLVFSGLALVLSSVLVATSLAAMLARQVREIGVMKTLGARSLQLVGMYVQLIGLLGILAFAAALPLGALGAHGFSRAVSSMLNFDLTDASIPAWVFAIQAAAALVVPLTMAMVPIVGAARRSVRSALDSFGVGGAVRSRRWLPVPVRNLLRRPRRLVFTVVLLATGGALFMTALAVSRSWQRNLDSMLETRHYDVELRLHAPPSRGAGLAGVPGVARVEWWGYSPAAFARRGHVDTVRTYPDRGHGSLTLMGPPAGTRLIAFPVVAGRWLRDDDTDGVVLNHVAARQGRLHVGDRVLLAADGVTHEWQVVGIVQEVGSPGIVYANAPALANVIGPPRMARVVTTARTAGHRLEVIRAVEDQLARAGGSVELVMPFAELRTAVGDHVGILINALVALATIFALVGLLGLGSAVGVSVVERTREIGVMKAVGASRARIARTFVAEAVITAAISWVVAVLVSLPLTRGIEALIGQLGFLAPLPFVVAPAAMAGWLVLMLAAGVVASLAPARRAAGVSVRDAICEV